MVRSPFRNNRWLLCGALIAAVASCGPRSESRVEPAPVAAAERARIGTLVVEYFEKVTNIPSNVTLDLKNLAPSEVPGILKGVIEASMGPTTGPTTQQVPFLVSRDGRYLVRGEFADLTIDPLASAVEKMSMKDVPERGPADAPVTIVEYSDFECSFCARAYHMFEDQIMKDYAGKVRLVFKNMPSIGIHPWALGAAIAAECARTQNPKAFWKMYDFLFQHQEQINADNLKDQVIGAAKDDGLDAGEFTKCIDAKQPMPRVDADLKEAQSLDIKLTPTFFINGRRVEGAVPYETFKEMLDREIASASPRAAGEH